MFNAVHSTMDCVCNPGWGGPSCNLEYCPNQCNSKLNYGTCVETLIKLRMEPANPSLYHADCIKAKNRTNLRASQYPLTFCHELTEKDLCTSSFVSTSLPSAKTHTLALCLWDVEHQTCGHSATTTTTKATTKDELKEEVNKEGEGWVDCQAKDGSVNGITGRPYYCECTAGFSGVDCSGTSGCGGTGHDCGMNGRYDYTYIYMYMDFFNIRY